jgi:hypothetical protein
MDNARIVVARGVTELYRRFEAEGRAHAESLAPQQDAQAMNRFTRHEASTKSGLFVGIQEFCDSLQSAYADIHNIMMDPG